MPKTALVYRKKKIHMSLEEAAAFVQAEIGSIVDKKQGCQWQRLRAILERICKISLA